MTSGIGRHRLGRTSYSHTRPMPVAAGHRAAYALVTSTALESDMGKYFIGWLLGVPAVVLVGIYLVSHL